MRTLTASNSSERTFVVLRLLLSVFLCFFYLSLVVFLGGTPPLIEAAFLFRIFGLPPFGGVLGGVVGGDLVGVVCLVVVVKTDFFCGNFSMGIVTT